MDHKTLILLNNSQQTSSVDLGKFLTTSAKYLKLDENPMMLKDMHKKLEDTPNHQ